MNYKKAHPCEGTPRGTNTRVRRLAGLLGPALVGWVLCGASIGIGRAVTSMQNTLIAHAMAAPLIFAIVAYAYFKKFNYTAPLQTAAIYVLIVMLMDLVVVATFVEKSYAMFGSMLGTWLPSLSSPSPSSSSNQLPD